MMTNFEKLLAKNGIESDKKPDKVGELNERIDATDATVDDIILLIADIIGGVE